MFSTFANSDVKKRFSRKSRIQSPRSTNFVFSLHYRFTFGFLAVAVILVTGYNYIDSEGSAIQCMTSPGIKVSNKIINRFCWIMSTYTLPNYNEGEIGKDVIAHGLGPHEKNSLLMGRVDPNDGTEEQAYHAYYQWVPLFLSFQAVMFYLPHFIWKSFEGNRFKNIVAGLETSFNKEEDDLSAQIQKLAEYITRKLNNEKEARYINKMWALKLTFCEMLNFINVIFQIWLTDVFLGGAFSSYGLDTLNWPNLPDEHRADPMYIVFPRMTKCMFHKFGVSGTIEKLDALCVLGMNIINEKIFLFLWFWFIVLAVITGLNLVVRLSIFLIPSMRLSLVDLSNFGSSEKSPYLKEVMNSLCYSDWFILYVIHQSIDRKCFRILIDKIYALNNKEDDSETDSLKKYGKLNRDATLRSTQNLTSYL